jgi:multiple sugar transport system ATP-binding protein
MATVTFRHLQKRYGDTRVLDDVDMDVADGEYVVIVGPSGCGKSTLLRCIAGLEQITSGELLIGGRRVNDVAPRDRNVAMVFQSYALYPHMTVRENMGFALRIQKMPAEQITRAVEDAATMLELTPLLDRLPGQLSGGQRQRVAMGRAIVRQPGVFLFDEPLSNLDPALRTHMRAELKRLHRRLGTSIFHVTHDQIEALTLADRIVALAGGVVQQIGTPRDLFDRPANAWVGQFIGSPKMNLLQVVQTGDAAVIEGTDQRVPTVPGVPRYQLGVRPSDIVLGRGDLRGVVDVIESLGHEALVHLSLGPHAVRALVPEPATWSPGEAVAFELTKVHRFAPETGARLADTP